MEFLTCTTLNNMKSLIQMNGNQVKSSRPNLDTWSHTAKAYANLLMASVNSVNQSPYRSGSGRSDMLSSHFSDIVFCD